MRQVLAQGIWLAAAERQELFAKFGTVSWSQLADPDKGDDWEQIIAKYSALRDMEPLFETLQPIRLKVLTQDPLDISTLWTIVFFEIARAGLETNAKLRSIDAVLDAGSLALEFRSTYQAQNKEDIQSEAAMRLGNPREPPSAGVWIVPPKPSGIGPGWGKRGNYTIVCELLGQDYQIGWKEHEEEEGLYYLCTKIELKRDAAFFVKDD
jgi:hypothetical protein